MNFAKQFGNVENVMMRRQKSENRSFKGSVFVTYKDQAEAEAFVKNDTKQFNGNDLLKMMQQVLTVFSCSRMHIFDCCAV